MLSFYFAIILFSTSQINIISVALDQRISSSTFFHAFLRMAQNETHLSSDDQKNVHIRITLPGEEVISIPVTPIQETSSVIKVHRKYFYLQRLCVHFIIKIFLYRKLLSMLDFRKSWLITLHFSFRMQTNSTNIVVSFFI